MSSLWSALPAVACAAVVLGMAQALAGLWAVRRFSARAEAEPADAGALPPVTILKPLHGDEPLLEAALESLCSQDYPRYQIVFGVQDPADPARAVAERLRLRHAGLDIRVVCDPTVHGDNRKVGNLMNMMPHARHDVIVIADSDLHARPDYLRRLLDALRQPGAGLATTLYAGLPAAGGLIGALGASQISHGFLPGAVLARALGRQDCLGATMALRRSTLEQIGGFRALVDHLADDNMLGRLVRAEGLGVQLATTVPMTTVPETTLRALFSHELRWARTIRALVPVSFVLAWVQYPLAWAALAFALQPAAGTACLFAAAWAARAGAALGVDHALAPLLGPEADRPALAKSAPVWLLPVRDVLSMAVMLASYGGQQVRWRGHDLRADDPAATPAGAPPAPAYAAPAYATAPYATPYAAERVLRT